MIVCDNFLPRKTTTCTGTQDLKSDEFIMSCNNKFFPNKLILNLNTLVGKPAQLRF